MSQKMILDNLILLNNFLLMTEFPNTLIRLSNHPDIGRYFYSFMKPYDLVPLKFVSTAMKKIADIFYSRRCISYTEFCCAEGYFNLLKWAMDLGGKYGTKTMVAAAKSGNLTTFKWLWFAGPDPDQPLTLELHSTGTSTYLVYTEKSAVTFNTIISRIWNASIGDIDTQAILSAAASMGHTQIIRWLKWQQKGAFRSAPIWNSNIAAQAAFGGHLETLKYLVGNPDNPSFSEHAVINDSSDCPLDENICRNAALGGHVDVLRYAIENGCPYSNKICADAVLSGNLNCVKWITEENLSSKTCLGPALAIVHGREDILEYLIEHNYVIDERTVIVACEHGRLGALKLLKEKGFYPTDECVKIVKNLGHDHILRWMVSIGVLVAQ